MEGQTNHLSPNPMAPAARLRRAVTATAGPAGTVLPARGPPQGELEFDQSAGREEWVEVDQTAGLGDGD